MEGRLALHLTVARSDDVVRLDGQYGVPPEYWYRQGPPGSEVNVCDDTAWRRDLIEVLRELSAKTPGGVDARTRDGWRRTALHIASQTGTIDAVEATIDSKADLGAADAGCVRRLCWPRKAPEGRGAIAAREGGKSAGEEAGRQPHGHSLLLPAAGLETRRSLLGILHLEQKGRYRALRRS